MYSWFKSMLHGADIAKISKKNTMRRVNNFLIIHQDISLLKSMAQNTPKFSRDTRLKATHIFFSSKEERLLSIQAKEEPSISSISSRRTDLKMFRNLIVDSSSSKKDDKTKWQFTGDHLKPIQNS